jgi:hypothetical protein
MIIEKIERVERSDKAIRIGSLALIVEVAVAIILSLYLLYLLTQPLEPYEMSIKVGMTLSGIFFTGAAAVYTYVKGLLDDEFVTVLEEE